MFLLNGSPLSPDTGFSVGGIQYPANWLRLASADEKAAIGIVEVAEPARADDRFFWNGDASLPKDVDQVKAMLIGQIKQTAGSMLAATDWRIVRAAEGVKPVDADTLAERAAIRSASNANESAIIGSTTTAELAVLQFTWPETA